MEQLRIGSAYEYVSIELPQGISVEGWIESRAEIVVDGFQGQILPWFQWIDFVRFAASLRKLHETLKGTAELRPCEAQLTLELTCDNCGHVTMKGNASSNIAGDNILTFEISLDQTFLAEPIRVLESWIDSMRDKFPEQIR